MKLLTDLKIFYFFGGNEAEDRELQLLFDFQNRSERNEESKKPRAGATTEVFL